MLVSEAAKEIGINVQTLRLGLQQRLFPFGEAILTSENRYSYHINPSLLKRYKEGTIYEKHSNTWNSSNDSFNRV